MWSLLQSAPTLLEERYFLYVCVKLFYSSQIPYIEALKTIVNQYEYRKHICATRSLDLWNKLEACHERSRRIEMNG